MSATFGPYTPVSRAGELYFVSGQVGVDPDTKTASADVAAQTRQALKNLESVLEGSGLALSDVVKTTVFLADMSDFATMNGVYEQVFDTPRPARSTVGIKELPRVAGDTKILVEIEAIAYKEKS